ncbi:ABC transporter permease [Thermomonospora umbrina]|uniref:ABC-type nitrate/sulfonate/bicarbonate transport system permease component n=1 Tax=Thermomonospora umbrina TaxID=111806 RepID=A0A3D9T1M0_9ACTN|nr:ABC transporter permease [Thermomonospora umbrina]REE97721.1 ABC-type nitrate/sulfonate/bicarbonate transport system permease component [Thermomonospora umbrina]
MSGVRSAPGTRVRALAARSLGWWAIVVIVACWEAVTRAAGNPFAPPPSRIAERMRELWFSGPADRLWLTDAAIDNVPPSVGRLLAGWALASIVGIVVGLAIGRIRVLGELVEPVLHFARAIPPTALAPVWIVLFDLGLQTQLVTIMFGVVWPVLLNTVDGARSVEAVQSDTARVYGLGPLQRVVYLVIPSAAPKIFAGLRISLGLAVILMVVSEMTGSVDGIAFSLLLDAQRSYDIPAMWGGICVLGALGYLLALALDRCERRAMARHPAGKAANPRLETTHV